MFEKFHFNIRKERLFRNEYSNVYFCGRVYQEQLGKVCAEGGERGVLIKL